MMSGNEEIIRKLDHWRQQAVTGDLQDTLAETIAEIRRLREQPSR